MKDKEQQYARRDKAIHDKEIELFQRETALQLALRMSAVISHLYFFLSQMYSHIHYRKTEGVKD